MKIATDNLLTVTEFEHLMRKIVKQMSREERVRGIQR